MILFATLFTSGCVTLNEPDIYVCGIVNDDTAACVSTNPARPDIDIKLNTMLGYFCTSPNDFAEIRKHHDRLHKLLKDKKGVR